MKARQLIKTLQQNGWYIARTRGSHRQLKHERFSGTVTVPCKLNTDLQIGTLKAIQKQAQQRVYEDEQ